MRNHEYRYRDIVVGHSLPAVVYAYKNKLPLILNSKKKPFPFDEIVTVDIPELELKTTNTEKAWSFIVLEHAMNGLVPFGTAVESVRFEEDRMYISLGGAFSVQVAFEKCYVFEDDNLILENDVVPKQEEKFRVFDWFDVRSGTKHDVDLLKSADGFVNKLYFYKSERVDGNLNIKDCVAESHMTIEQLDSFDFSPTMARFKIQKMMSDSGMLGAKDGRSATGRQRYAAIKLEPRYRDKRRHALRYKSNKHVEFIGQGETK
jgi:hypothetical protein